MRGCQNVAERYTQVSSQNIRDAADSEQTSRFHWQCSMTGQDTHALSILTQHQRSTRLVSNSLILTSVSEQPCGFILDSAMHSWKRRRRRTAQSA